MERMNGMCVYICYTRVEPLLASIVVGDMEKMVT